MRDLDPPTQRAAALASLFEQLCLGLAALKSFLKSSPQQWLFQHEELVSTICLKLEQLCQAILSKDPLRIPCSPRAGTVFKGESGGGIENLGRAESLVNIGHQGL